MNSPLILLNEREVAYVIREGTRRQDDAEAKCLHHAHGLIATGPAKHIEGAGYEMAFAKWLGYPYGAPRGELGDVDYAAFEVRGTPRDGGSLILHESHTDDPQDAFVLVTGTLPQYEIRGWLWGSEGQLAKYWKQYVRRPAFFVPRHDLHKLARLPHTFWEGRYATVDGIAVKEANQRRMARRATRPVRLPC